MIIKTITNGIYEENCYILMDEETKECGIIDPGGSANLIKENIKNIAAKPKYILLTHGHFDHVGAVEELSKQYNIPFYISRVDEEYMEKDNSVFGSLSKASGYLKEGDKLKLGENILDVIETPGHTKGGLCFLVGDKLFTGDTLFQCSVGRTDFVGGDTNEIINSIRNKLLILSENTEVYPGHGPKSTIGFEKSTNPYIQ